MDGAIDLGKFDGILICTDLDGTLYRNDKTISRENKEAIEYFKDEGGYFTFITGRMPGYSLDAYNAINPNVPFGCINGGGVYDGKAKKYIWKQEMPLGFLDLIQNIDEQFSDVGIQVCLFDKTCFVKENQTMKHFRKETGLPNIVCDYREITDPVAKVIFGTDSEEEMQGVMKTLLEHPLSEKYDFIRSQKNLFEILPKGVNKGLSVTRLVEYLGIDIKKTVAIGDYDNDVGMFLAAGVGIAVSNAAKSALEACDYITVSNEEHAICRVISDLEKGKYPI